MRPLGFLGWFAMSISLVGCCEERDIPFPEDHFDSVMEYKTLHEGVEALCRYRGDYESLEQKKEKTNEEAELYKQYCSDKNFDKLKLEIRVYQGMYRRDPDREAGTRASDLDSLAALLKWADSKSKLPAEQSDKKEVVEGQVASGKEEKPSLVLRRPDAAERKELEEFLKQLEELLSAAKYVEVARKHLDYGQEIPDYAWPKVLPGATQKLEGETTHGGLNLIKALKEDKEHWYLFEKRALLYRSGEGRYSYLRCAKGKEGEWKLQSISRDIPHEFREAGIVGDDGKFLSKEPVKEETTK